MAPPCVIALCGRLRCGKDTVAKVLVDEYGYENLKISQLLKNACKMLFDLTDEQIEGTDKDKIDERWNVSPRRILQFMGTEVMQYKIQELIPGVGRTFWMNHLIRNNIIKSRKPVVISDMRFIHEYESLATHIPHVKVIKIERPSDDPLDSHVSETEYHSIKEDFRIVNDGSIDELYDTVKKIMKKIQS